MLLTPDIVAAVEVENLNALQAIASRVNADAGSNSPNYVAYLVEGSDPGLIDVGFLVKPSRIEVLEVLQVGKTDTYINPANGQPDLIFDRPPLVLRALAGALPITVIVNHFRSLNGVDDAVDGPRVHTKRRAEAEFLANYMQARQTANPSEQILTLGDFNAFEFSDGLVDLIDAGGLLDARNNGGSGLRDRVIGVGAAGSRRVGGSRSVGAGGGVCGC